MKYIKNIFKISIVLLLLLVCIGSIYAADNAHAISSEDDGMDDDFELDDNFDDEDDDSDDYLGDDDGDDGESDEDEEEDEQDEEDDEEDEWDESDEELDGNDEDDILDDYNYTDFEFLKIKITFYLDKYGNYTGHNWTESEEFLNEYQIYLVDSQNYTLNESSEGYETYLKIYDSITSTFDDYNLTENETDYLKFMVIFYLNHYGNVSANYTWNESESFQNYTLPFDVLLGAAYDMLKGSATSHEYNHYSNSYYNPIFAPVIGNSTDVNHTSTGNQTGVEVQQSHDLGIFILILVIVLVVLIML